MFQELQKTVVQEKKIRIMILQMLFSQRSAWHHDKKKNKAKNEWTCEVPQFVIRHGHCSSRLAKIQTGDKGFPSVNGLHVNPPHRHSPNQGKGYFNPLNPAMSELLSTDCKLWSQWRHKVPYKVWPTRTTRTVPGTDWGGAEWEEAQEMFILNHSIWHQININSHYVVEEARQHATRFHQWLCLKVFF